MTFEGSRFIGQSSYSTKKLFMMVEKIELCSLPIQLAWFICSFKAQWYSLMARECEHEQSLPGTNPQQLFERLGASLLPMEICYSPIPSTFSPVLQNHRNEFLSSTSMSAWIHSKLNLSLLQCIPNSKEYLQQKSTHLTGSKSHQVQWNIFLTEMFILEFCYIQTS